MNCPYHSRDIRHKSVFGAVSSKQTVRFSLLIPRSFSCSGACFVVKKDKEPPRNLELSWSGLSEDGTAEWWGCDYAFPEPGVWFYHFEYRVPYGTGKIFLKSAGLGTYAPTGEEWRQTVYDVDFATPDWIKGGIMYQIFPDRFFGFSEKKNNIPGDRVLHASPEEPLVWRPDESGEIRNNDYYGGTLCGIIQKLDYLKSLSVTALYLNPIFEAHSNHRYNTADYTKIDPMLGDESSLEHLCAEAQKRGIRVILDGVFSHTGADSVYFNKEKRYGEGGAYHDAQSPYRRWYTFTGDGRYKCWWNIKSLPELNETEPTYLDFITGHNGILKKWLKTGISGWRLDVADELPDAFLDALYQSVKEENADHLIIGEVWEDATYKFSYGQRRRYLLGGQLDGVMNYPFADAILAFLRGGTAEEFMESVMQVCENYPAPALNVLMNHIGTHDTARILTRLTDETLESRPRSVWAQYRITPEDYEKSKALLKTAAVLQYTLPGFPSVYYGDEAGMSGGGDPFNRACYPWGHEDKELLAYYRMLGQLRTFLPCLKEGAFVPVSAMLSCVAFARECKKTNTGILVIVNRNNHGIDYFLPERYQHGEELLTNTPTGDFVTVPEKGAAIVRARYL